MERIENESQIRRKKDQKNNAAVLGLGYVT